MAGEWSFRLALSGTLGGKDQVVGVLPISWSQNNCISLGTSKSALIYELNPLKDVTSADILFKSQVISLPSKLEHDVEVSGFLQNQDVLRSVTSRSSDPPAFDAYQVYLHCAVGDMENSGIQASSFSSCGCGPRDGSVLALLSSTCRLMLYVKSSDGMRIQWTKAIDLSEILLASLSKYGGYLPDGGFLFTKKTGEMAWQKQYAAAVKFAAWSAVFPGENKTVFLVACTKTDHVLMWKFRLPINSATEARVLCCTEISEDEIGSLSVLKSPSAVTCNIALGGVHGTVTCISFDGNGQEIQRCKVWKEKDDLAVSCIEWAFSSIIKGASDILAGKVSVILHVRMTSGLEVLSSSVFKSKHSFPVIHLVNVGSNLWLSASSDGEILKVWLERTGESVKQMSEYLLKSEVKRESGSTPGVSRRMTHQIAVSPNLAFLAILKSKSKVSRSVMMENSAYLEIRTLRSGMESFKHLCLSGAFDDHPAMDSLESIRQHLLHKEFFNDDAGLPVLQACIQHYIDGKAQSSNLKWCVLKVFDTNSTTSQMLRRLEKQLVSKQMLKVLRCWVDSKARYGVKDPPVQNIIKWLSENSYALDQKDKDFLESAVQCDKYGTSTVEVCSVTGERLIMSDDARHAISAITRISWPRCCLTFSAIQGFAYRKCDISDSCSCVSDEYEPVLLQSPSIYSGLQMI